MATDTDPAPIVHETEDPDSGIDWSEVETLPNFDENMRAAMEIFWTHLMPRAGFLGMAPFQLDNRSPNERYHLQIFFDSTDRGVAASTTDLRLAAIEAQREYREKRGGEYNFGFSDTSPNSIATSIHWNKHSWELADLFRPAIAVADRLSRQRQVWIDLFNGAKDPQDREHHISQITQDLINSEPSSEREARADYWRDRVKAFFDPATEEATDPDSGQSGS